MADSGRLALEEALRRIERRQDAMIKAISELAGVVGITNTMVGELMEWMKQPPSENVGEIIAQLVVELKEARKDIAQVPERVVKALRG